MTADHDAARRAERHGQRLVRFGAALGEAGFVAAIVAHPRDLFYLCATAQPCNLLVVPGREPVLFARRFGRLVREQSVVSDVVDDASTTAIARRLSALGVRSGRVGLALDVIPAALCNKIAASLPRFEIDDYSPTLLAQRAVKDAHEVDELRQAGAMFHAAHEAICATARPGVAEHEVSAEVARALRRAGHEGHVFYRRWDANLQPEGLLVSGPNLARISGHAITITGVGMSDALPFGAGRR